MRRALLDFLRATHLIALADWSAAQWAALQLRSANTDYRRAHPQRSFPSPTLIYEVAGHADIAHFDETGARHARLIAERLRAVALRDAPRVLEWGCGPGRILAHLPDHLPSAKLYGCDPDARAIAHVRRALSHVEATRSAAMPPLPYGDGAFDAIYGISILTHLPERAADAWVRELARIVADDGCVLVTTHGDYAAGALSDSERAAYNAGKYVVRGGAPVGSRTFAAYLNATGAQRLFGAWFGGITHIPGNGVAIGQDIWVLKAPRRRA
jgi:SAM-dependent methyltransferase